MQVNVDDIKKKNDAYVLEEVSMHTCTHARILVCASTLSHIRVCPHTL